MPCESVIPICPIAGIIYDITGNLAQVILYGGKIESFY